MKDWPPLAMFRKSRRWSCFPVLFTLDGTGLTISKVEDPNEGIVMTVVAIEAVLNVAKTVAVSVLKAHAAGTPLAQAVQSPEFQAAVTQALADAAQVPAEAAGLTLMDDLELGRYVYGAVADIVQAVKAGATPKAA